MIQLSIIRADGIPEQSEFHLYLDGSLIPQHPALQEPSYILKLLGNLKIVTKSPNKKSSLYCTFPVELLPNEGFQWVPLSPNPYTILDQFPEDASDPKILILVSNEFLDPIEESPELDCENCENYKSDKNKMQVEMIKAAKDAKNQIDALTAENEKNRVLVKKFTGLYMDCKKELEVLKVRLEEERKKNSDFSEKIKSLTLTLDENTLKAKMREEFLETLINDREKEYKTKVKTESHPCLTASIQPNIENLNSAQIGLKENLSQVQLSRRKVLTEIPNSQPGNKDTEVALRRFLVKTNRRGMFVKDQGNMYRFGKKKVFIALKHGNLLCRVGGGFENIEEFILKNHETKQSVSPISDKNHKRRKTFDTSGKLEDFEEVGQGRSSPEIEKLIKSRIRPLSTSLAEYT